MVIPPTWVYWGCNRCNPPILTFDPNFPGHPSTLLYNFNLRLVVCGVSFAYSMPSIAATWNAKDGGS